MLAKILCELKLNTESMKINYLKYSKLCGKADSDKTEICLPQKVFQVPANP